MKWEFRNISKQFGNKAALQNVNIEAEEGVYALLSPNGAGKSTLMRILVGLLKPTEGEILLEGHRIQPGEYQNYIGYLPQSFHGYGAFTGMDMLYYIAAMKGFKTGKTLDEQIGYYIRYFEMEDDINRKMREYSGGMLRRIGIIQALIGYPQLLVFDEPTAGLDPKQRVYFQRLLLRLKRKKTILISTHILSDVDPIADKILLINDGKVRTEDNSEIEKKYLEEFS